MKNKMIGIAKKDLKKNEIFEIPVGEGDKLLINENINFIEGTILKDLKGNKK